MRLNILLLFVFLIVLSSVAHADYTGRLSWLSNDTNDYLLWHNFTNMTLQTKGTNNMNSSACYNTTNGQFLAFYNGSECSTYHGFFTSTNISSGVFSIGIIMNEGAKDATFLRLYGIEHGGNFSNDSNIMCGYRQDYFNNFIYYINGSDTFQFSPNLSNQNISGLFFTIDYDTSNFRCNYKVYNSSDGTLLYSALNKIPYFNNTNNLAIGLLRGQLIGDDWTGDELRAWANYSAFLYANYTLRFYDSVTRNSIQPATIYSTVINSVNASNYTTITGNVNVSVLRGEINTIRSVSSGYSESFYYIIHASDLLVNNLSIYLTNTTGNSEVTVTVIDEAGDPVEDSYVEILRYNSVTNNYDTVEVRKTNFAGQFKFYATLNTEFYKFIVEYPFGNVVKITSPSYIFSTSLTLQINTEAPTGQNIFIANGVSYSLTYNNDTTNFRYTFSNNNNAITNTCLKLYKVVNTNDVLWNNTCVTSTAGTILQDVYNTSGTTWKAKVYIYPSGSEYYLTEGVASFNDEYLSSKLPLLFLLIITLTISFIAVWDKIVGIMLVPIPAIIFSAVGLWNIPIYYPIGIEALAFIIAIILSSKTK